MLERISQLAFVGLVACTRAASPILASGPSVAPEAVDTSEPRSVRPGINDRYFEQDGLEAAIKQLETERREVAAQREAIVAALDLREGMVVADVGAGTGLFLAPLSRVLGPSGKLYALDIVPHFVAHLRERVAREGLGNVEVVEGVPGFVAGVDPALTGVFDVTLADGTAVSPLRDAVVILRDGRIDFAGPRDSAPAVPGAETVDLRTLTVVPAMVDCHAHITGTGGSDAHARLQDPDAVLAGIRQAIDEHVRSAKAHRPLDADGPLAESHGTRYRVAPANAIATSVWYASSPTNRTAAPRKDSQRIGVLVTPPRYPT